MGKDDIFSIPMPSDEDLRYLAKIRTAELGTKKVKSRVLGMNKEKVALCLRLLEGMSISEVSTAMNIPVSKIEAMLTRSLCLKRGCQTAAGASPVNRYHKSIIPTGVRNCF